MFNVLCFMSPDNNTEGIVFLGLSVHIWCAYFMDQVLPSDIEIAVVTLTW